MKKYLIALLLVGIGLTSCNNSPLHHPDYGMTSVYFAYQTPVRTIVLGEDETTDTTLDNEYRCQIIATIGGLYEQTKEVEIGIKVDNSLVDNLSFDGTRDVLAMPSNYYTLGSTDRITMPKGEFFGRLDVQLTDAFFSDPLAVENNYVIPILMTGVSNADSILQGIPLFPNPNRAIDNDWDVLPKDYILYAVKYINKYTANWLRGGTDVFSGSRTGTVERDKEYVEYNEVIATSTISLNAVEYPVSVMDANNTQRDCTLILTFDSVTGNCTVTSGTEEVAVSGSGKYEAHGAKQSWGNKDRDRITLNYTLDFGDMQVATDDVLVIRDRGVLRQEFTPVLKN
ncbi:MAG: DUF5627 domain-containing protein [Alistipes sp.]|jgi:hypothetical protein|nr:DUF5627 domain-containing protein [Alistipes sp.]